MKYLVENRPGAVRDQPKRRKWNWLGHTVRINCETCTIVDAAKPQRKTANKEHLEKRSQERNVAIRI